MSDASIRDRRKALGILMEDFCRIAAVGTSTLTRAEFGEAVRIDANTRIEVALSALERGLPRDQARDAALAAAPIDRSAYATGINRARPWSGAPHCPEIDPLPAMCFAGHDVRTQTTGRISAPEPSLVRSAMS